jgi:hypothetical protein
MDREPRGGGQPPKNQERCRNTSVAACGRTPIAHRDAAQRGASERGDQSDRRAADAERPHRQPADCDDAARHSAHCQQSHRVVADRDDAARLAAQFPMLGPHRHVNYGHAQEPGAGPVSLA